MAKTTVDNAPTGAVAVREGFGVEELVAQGDLMAASSAAAVAKELEVRAILAERHPRNVDLFREQILRYCKHPDFAEQALYMRKVGRKQDAEGQWVDSFAINFSIRFIEAALPLYRNLYTATRITYDDPEKLILNVQVYDVETNTGYGQDAILPKLVERREGRDRIVRGARVTSEGKQIYIVEASKDEMRNVFGAERSRLIRDYGQKLLPFHVLAECRRLIDLTNATENAKDPDAAKKKILDKFAALGISAPALTAYVERDLSTLTQADLAELAVLYNGLREGEFTWGDVVRLKTADPEAPAEEPTGKSTKLKDKILDARERARPKEQPAPVPAAPPAEAAPAAPPPEEPKESA